LSSKLEKARVLLKKSGDKNLQVRLRVDNLSRAFELMLESMEDMVEVMLGVIEKIEGSGS